MGLDRRPQHLVVRRQGPASSGSDSQRQVEPSMSVNRNVTTPRGPRWSSHLLGPLHVASKPSRWPSSGSDPDSRGRCRRRPGARARRARSRQQPDVAKSRAALARCHCYPVDRDFGLNYILVGAALEQCLHQSTRRRHAQRCQLPLKHQLIDGGMHQLDRVFAISASKPLTRHENLYEPESQRFCCWRTHRSLASASTMCPRSRSAAVSRCTSATPRTARAKATARSSPDCSATFEAASISSERENR